MKIYLSLIVTVKGEVVKRKHALTPPSISAQYGERELCRFTVSTQDFGGNLLRTHRQLDRKVAGWCKAKEHLPDAEDIPLSPRPGEIQTKPPNAQ